MPQTLISEKIKMQYNKDLKTGKLKDKTVIEIDCPTCQTHYQVSRGKNLDTEIVKLIDHSEDKGKIKKSIPGYFFKTEVNVSEKTYFQYEKHSGVCPNCEVRNPLFYQRIGEPIVEIAEWHSTGGLFG